MKTKERLLEDGDHSLLLPRCYGLPPRKSIGIFASTPSSNVSQGIESNLLIWLIMFSESLQAIKYS